jgi:23S rRNA pseudouridine1911/1915/1917 synthase
MGYQELVSKEKIWTVTADREGMRLDSFVRRVLPHLSRVQVERAIHDRFFMVNDRTGTKGSRLATGDIVTFAGLQELLSAGPAANSLLEVAIVYEDSQLLVVDKPAGMDIHGFSGRNTDTLANFLAAQRPEVLGVGTSPWEPGLVHRLDRETSGLVLVAKTQAAFEDLRRQFHQRKVGKKYRALVWGEAQVEGLIDFSLAHDSRDKRRMRVADSNVKYNKARKTWPALTRYRRLAVANGVSLLEIEMETGVTHQIRVHLAAIGHPIVGDVLYGSENLENFGLPRHFLHALILEFYHPTENRTVCFEAPLPQELHALLKSLEMKF